MRSRSFLAGAIGALALTTATFVAAPTASAVTIESSGPLMDLQWNPDLSCQTLRFGDTEEAFYGTDACGTFVNYGGTPYGPSVSAGPGATSYTEVSQSPITGNGTAASPFTVDTVVQVPGAFRIDQRDVYVVGDEMWTTTMTLTNLGGSTAVKLGRGGDCYQANSDNGFGRITGSNPACVSEGGRIQELQALTPGNTFIEASYGTAWSALVNANPLPNTCRCDEEIDNGVAVAWIQTLAPGATMTVSSRWFLSSSFVAFAPQRIMDTRTPPDGQTVDHLFEGPGAGGAGAGGAFADGQTIELQVGGRAGVSTDASSAILNVAVTQTSGPGFLTLWPCDAAGGRPNASSVNYVSAGVTTSVSVYAKLSATGKLCIYALRGTHVIVDVNGYQPNSSTAFQTVNPARLLETRPDGEGTIDGQFLHIGRRPAGTVTAVTVVARQGSGVPADASAVILSVAGVVTDGPGYLTVWPCGQTQPNASNVNFSGPGAVVPNSVISQVGTNGQVCIFNSTGMDVIADVNGFAPASADYHSITPARVFDSRPDGQVVPGGTYGTGMIGPNDTGTSVQITGIGGVEDGATAATVNITVVGATAPGYLTAWPCGAPRPASSNVNYGPGITTANLAMAGLSGSGTLCFYALNQVHLIVDVAGFFPA
jgi:hypothetical protein